ncbi:MAG: hypothetical protein ACEY3J_03325 [Arsenophonus sp.]
MNMLQFLDGYGSGLDGYGSGKDDIINSSRSARLPSSCWFYTKETSDVLSYYFWNNALIIHHNEEYEKI